MLKEIEKIENNNKKRTTALSQMVTFNYKTVTAQDLSFLLKLTFINTEMSL